MESFILAVCFGGFMLGLCLFTAFLYFLLVKAVQNKEEVPFQSELYSLWKRYTITGKFNSHDSYYRYEVGVQYSLWE